MQRSSCWKHPDGQAATLDALTDAVAKHADHLTSNTTDIYDSTDFKVGIDVVKLKASEPVILELVQLDTRGGFFSQGDLVAAVLAAIQPGSFASAMAAKRMPMDELVTIMCYKLRVMLSHVRYAFDSQRPGTLDHPLQEVFAIMDSPTHQGGTARKQRRLDRLGRRPNPFICFRGAADGEAPADEDEDEISCISKYFDGCANAAKALLSNGEALAAGSYSAGPKGFAIAHWSGMGMSYELEIPNSCIHEDGKQLIKWTPPPKRKYTRRIMKKPAVHTKNPAALMAKPAAYMKSPAACADRASEESGSDGSAELSDPEEADGADAVESAAQHDEETATASLKLRSGHKDMQTITVCSHSRDKAQLVVVSGSMCSNSKLNPKQVCEEIMKQMGEQASSLKPPVATSPELPQLRLKAKELRSQIISD
jgi:hypothetical protein